MNRVTIKAGDGPYGPQLTKFTLTYEGELRANDTRRKWAIRKHFHPQLQELWRIHPALHAVEKIRHLPKAGYWQIEKHHSEPDTRTMPSDGAWSGAY